MRTTWLMYLPPLVSYSRIWISYSGIDWFVVSSHACGKGDRACLSVDVNHACEGLWQGRRGIQNVFKMTWFLNDPNDCIGRLVLIKLHWLTRCSRLPICRRQKSARYIGPIKKNCLPTCRRGKNVGWLSADMAVGFSKLVSKSRNSWRQFTGLICRRHIDQCEQRIKHDSLNYRSYLHETSIEEFSLWTINCRRQRQ